MDITDADIRTYRSLAGSQDRHVAVATCDDALEGDTEARDLCAKWIQSDMDDNTD